MPLKLRNASNNFLIVNKMNKKRKEKMEDFPYADEDYRLFYMLLRVREKLFESRERELFQYNIRLRHSACLFAIKELGNIATPNEIAKIVHRKPHSVSVMLNRMEKNGLIKKKKASNGGNRVIVTLTRQGEHAFKVSSKRESLHRVFSALTKTQRQQLRDCLKTLWVSCLKERENHLPLVFPFEED